MQGSSVCSTLNVINRSSTSALRRRTDSLRFAVSDPHESPVSRSWYDAMLANKVHRWTDGQRGSKYGVNVRPRTARRDRVDHVKTESNSTSDGREVLSGKLAEVKLVLVLMDALLVLHRLMNLYLDVSSLNSVSSWSTEEATTSVVSLSERQLVACSDQSRVVDDKHEQQSQSDEHLIHLRTPTHIHGEPRVTKPYVFPMLGSNFYKVINVMVAIGRK